NGCGFSATTPRLASRCSTSPTTSILAITRGTWRARTTEGSPTASGERFAGNGYSSFESPFHGATITTKSTGGSWHEELARSARCLLAIGGFGRSGSDWFPGANSTAARQEPRRG